MSEINDMASVIARAELCKCGQCRQCVTDLPIKPNPNEKNILRKLKHRIASNAMSFQKKYRRGDDGEWYEVK